MRMKLIPAVIILAAMGISFRAGNIWDSVFIGSGDGQAVAQEASEGLPPPPTPGLNPEDAEPLQLDETDVPILDGSEGLHPVEARLANSLALRRADLEQRERELEEREAMLAVAEDRILAQQNELESLKREIERLVVRYEDGELEDSEKLQRTYENMKPKRAAVIFNELDLDTILKIVRTMSERKLAPILESMDPVKAVAVTQELQAREDLPQFQ